jgi:DNA end-binding protein Ku
MSGEWNPDQFEDEYRTALMDLIERKIKSGQTEAVEDVEAEEEDEDDEPKSINFMDVLRQSVEHAKRPKRAAKKRPAKKKAAPRRKAAKKKRAG